MYMDGTIIIHTLCNWIWLGKYSWNILCSSVKLNGYRFIWLSADVYFWDCGKADVRNGTETKANSIIHLTGDSVPRYLFKTLFLERKRFGTLRISFDVKSYLFYQWGWDSFLYRFLLMFNNLMEQCISFLAVFRIKTFATMAVYSYNHSRSALMSSLS